MDLAGFRERRPEFANIADAQITAALADAAGRLASALLGAVYDEAQMWLAAHLLAQAPWGYAARLQGTTDGSTVYSQAYQRIVNERGAGYGAT